MARKSVRSSAIVAAFAVSSITLAVFFVLRESGPASVLRLFHIAAVQRDYTAIAYLVTPDSNPEKVRNLIGRVQAYARSGGRYQLWSTMRPDPNTVVAEVYYYVPRSPDIVIWALEKREGRWRIDANSSGSRL